MRRSFCDDMEMVQQRNTYLYPLIHTVSQSHSHEFRPQEFHYFVVINFEATCDKLNQPNPQEIIEFPSVLVNGLTGIIEDCFQTYIIRPTHHPLLTDLCKELTGIKQTQVDSGVSLSMALFNHDKWLRERAIKNTNFTVVTWTEWDCRTMLESECRLKRIYKHAYFNRWINLKVAFHEVYGHVRCKLKEAVELAGLTWEGRPHCGLDDARNTARLLIQLMRRGFLFSITSSMECPNTQNQIEKAKGKGNGSQFHGMTSNFR